MFSPMPCPSCEVTITDEHAMTQNLSLDDAFCYVPLTMNCPHCGVKLSVQVDMYWSLKVLDE